MNGDRGVSLELQIQEKTDVNFLLDLEMEEKKSMIITSVDSITPTKPPSLEFAKIFKNVVLISTVIAAFLVLYYASLNNFGEFLPTINFSSPTYGLNYGSSSSVNETVRDEHYELRKVLKGASTKDNTVILTTLNEAWAAPNSIFDLFLESFRVGDNTTWLLNHLLVIATDDAAYARCQAVVPHCYYLKTNQSSEMAHQAMFMSPIYLEMMWGRLAFLQTILRLGYNFVFTDTDVMWFRSPFPHFTKSADFQTSCDNFNGHQFDLRNFPNNGFVFVRSNYRTIKFYKFWVSSRHTYPGIHEQNVFNIIKGGPFAKRLRLKMRFLDTNYFGGFCSPSRDFNKVCTMHANCCVGLDRKIADLNTTLEDWKNYFYSNHTRTISSHWRVPLECKM